MIVKVGPGSATPDGSAVKRLRGYVEACAVPRDVRRQPEANARIRDWLRDAFHELGYVVTLQGQYDNVVALPAESSVRLPLVCAHYDSVATTPGADDNASAVAVMLEVARACADATVGFVAFNSEEHGLAGSFDFVRNYLPTAPCDVEVAHVLEMVGYTSRVAGSQRAPAPLQLPDVGDFLGLVADEASAADLEYVLRCAAALDTAPLVVGLELPAGALRLLPDAFRSDHAPFWLAGRRALMWTDTAEFRNPHYHAPSDTPDTLDYEFMARIAALVELAVT